MHAAVFIHSGDGSASFLSANTFLQAHFLLENVILHLGFSFSAHACPSSWLETVRWLFSKPFTSSPCMQIEDSVDNTNDSCKASARGVHDAYTFHSAAQFFGNDVHTVALYSLSRLDQHCTTRRMLQVAMLTLDGEGLLSAEAKACCNWLGA